MSNQKKAGFKDRYIPKNRQQARSSPYSHHYRENPNNAYNNHYYGYNNYKNNYHQFRPYQNQNYFKPSNYLGNWQKPKSPTAFLGSEEYENQKIKERSNLLKQQLLMPFDANAAALPSNPPVPITTSCESNKSSPTKDPKVSQSPKTSSNKKAKFDAAEIHSKIMNHLTNLNHGRKMNLISSNQSGYDPIIQQIQRQKRLELTKAFRDLCSNQSSENSEYINSIIPDIGIKIEDLPLEIIRELSSTFDIDCIGFEPIPQEDVCFNDFSEESDSKDEITDVTHFLAVNEAGVGHFCDEVDVKKEIVAENQVITDVLNGDNVFNKTKVKNEKNDEADVLFVADSPNSIEVQHNLQTKVVSPTSLRIKEEKMEKVRDKRLESISTQSESQSCNEKTKSCAEMATVNVLEIESVEEGEELEDKVKNCDGLASAIGIMFEIDKEISRLTKLRQELFVKVSSNFESNSKSLKERGERKRVKLKENEAEIAPESTITKNEPKLYNEPLEFVLNTSDKILVLKIIENTLLVGTESGQIMYFDLKNGQMVAISKITEAAVTSFCYCSLNGTLYVGSLDPVLAKIDYHNKIQKKSLNIRQVIQCMELAWDYIFVGTVGGFLLRYSIKKDKIEFADQVSNNRILVLKATTEGGRRVLLVGSRYSPICIRDAMSGLQMRTLDEVVSPTVYSLLLEQGLVYCGTTAHDILVYNFYDGSLVKKHDASNSKGISCMKVTKNLLFAGCCDGFIYVYSTKDHSYVGSINGLGGVILSMDIIANLIIIGTMSFQFSSVLIPEHIMHLNL